MNSVTPITLRHYVQQNLENYFSTLDGHKPADLYNMVLKEMEIPLLQAVLQYTNNNQSEAATILGISRGTLRKKIQTLQEFLG
jgi:Fis family transcriptional regulator